MRRLSPRLLAAWLMLGWVLAPLPASAHPHVFIDYVLAVRFEGDAPKAVRVSWTFDEMYSSMLFHDYTSRPRDALTPADVRSLREHAFDDTADYHYFVDLKLNGNPLEVKDAIDFAARFQNHRMTYSFTVPISAGAAPLARNTLEVDAFDNEFYIDFELAERNGVTVEHGEQAGAACAPKKVRRTTSVIGSVDTIVVACTYGTAG